MKHIPVVFGLLLLSWQVAGQAVRYSGEEKRLTPAGEGCVQELNLNREKIVAVEWFVDVLPEDDIDYNQFMGCLATTLGIMKPNGEMDFEKIKKAFWNPIKNETTSGTGFLKLYNQIVTDSVETCQKNSVVGISQGHIALKTLNCVARNIKKTVKGN